MMMENKFNSFTSLLFVLIVVFSNYCYCEISDFRLCIDEKCSVQISQARTLIRYSAPEKHLLSFQPNVEVKVFSKSAGSNQALWGVEIQGRRGYVPHKLIKEYRVIKKPTLTVPTELQTLKINPATGQPILEPNISTEKPTLNVPPELANVVDSHPSNDLPTNIEGNKASVEIERGEEVINITNETIPANDTALPSYITPEDVNQPAVSKDERNVADSPKPTVLSVEPRDIPVYEDPNNDLDEIVSVEDEDDGETVEDEDEDEDEEEEDDDEDNDNVEGEEKPTESENITEKSGVESNKIIPVIPEVTETPQTIEETESNSTLNAGNELLNQSQSNLNIESEQLLPVDDTLNIESIISHTTDTLEEASVNNTNETLSLDAIDNDNITSSSDSERIVNSSEVEPSNDSKPQTNEQLHENLNDNLNINQGIYHDHLSVPKDTPLSHLNTIPHHLPHEHMPPPLVASPYVYNSDHIPPIVNNQPIQHHAHSFGHLPLAASSHVYNNEQIPPIGNNVNREHEHENLSLDDNHNIHSHADQIKETINTDISSSEEKLVNSDNNDTMPLYTDVSNSETNLSKEDIHASSEDMSTPHPLNDGFIPELPPYFDATTESYLQPVTEEIDGDNQPKLLDVTETPVNQETISTESFSELPPIVQKSEPVEETTLPQYENKLDDGDTNSPIEQTSDVSGSVEEVKFKPTEVEPEVSSQKQEELQVDNSPGFLDSFIETFQSLFSKNEEPAVDVTDFEEDLNSILFSSSETKNIDESINDDEYCENVSPNACPKSKKGKTLNLLPPIVTNRSRSLSNFIEDAMKAIVKEIRLVIYLSISAVSVLLLLMIYYCAGGNRRDSQLYEKIRLAEQKMMVYQKEVTSTKDQLNETRQKLLNIEDNSFGSNDMVISLRHQLEESENKCVSLERELEAAAEAGLELNKMVSDLLNNPNTDSDSIISTVEELQTQLNEQQVTILTINTSLAEKSRENSELQILFNGQKEAYGIEINELRKTINNLQESNNQLTTELAKHEASLNEKREEIQMEAEKKIKYCQEQVETHQGEYNKALSNWQKAEAKLKALEESVSKIQYEKGVPKSFNIKEVLNAANIKSELLVAVQEKENIASKLANEVKAKKMLEEQIKNVNKEIAVLRSETNQAEKDKLEAQTRLDVLSNYFKEKEATLQKELSSKEALWMQQQGEATNTVERINGLQTSLQQLTSQNEALRAEIEAQSAAHKTQLASLENRIHESWLVMKQTERKLEEARSDNALLRRKLTSIADTENHKEAIDGKGTNDILDKLNNVPSPIHLDPALGGMLPPPMFLPPPPFMFPPNQGFMPPPPLGRLMSPPPGVMGNNHRYSPGPLGDSPYGMPRPYDDRSGSERGRHTPDSRYGFNHRYHDETETDFSPPPSPPRRRRNSGSSGSGSQNYLNSKHSDRSAGISPQPRRNNQMDNRGKRKN